MSSVIEKYDHQFKYAGVLLNLMVAYQFLILWISPSIEDPEKIKAYAMLMVFEFILVHSGVFMAVMPKKISLFVFVPFYAIFAFGLNAAMKDNTLFIIYLLVVLNRMRFAFSDVTPTIKSRIIITSILAAVSYLILAFAVVLPRDYIPTFGLNEKFLITSGYTFNKTGSGIFVDSPHIAICLGVLYYCSLALIEVLFLRKDFKNITIL